MAVPSEHPNVAKVMRAVEYLLQRINHSHPTLDFYTNGIVVDRGRDPTGIRDDKPDEFRRLARAVGIMPGEEEENPPRTGGVRRFRHSYPLMCLVELTDADREAGLRLDDVVTRLVRDLKVALDPDQRIKDAAAALEFNGISCIGHHVTGDKTDESVNWPFCDFVVVATFEYDEPVVR